ncbi:MAG TPA: enoyl-CoA hydratase-related protein [Solirubrobacteraceae bacterium]|nr:enoyl-CoA hydratase-related protein [Solirubrobacteraceae bacterium]
MRERVAWITLNRPEALNAWNLQFGHDLSAALDHAAADDQVRAVVITGAGRAFSSGADLKSDALLGKNGRPDVLTPLREVFNPLIMRVRSLPKPVIAAVNGAAAGIGCSLALAADLIVAAESAYFLLAFANIGLTLDGGASALLVARIGHARASQMALLAPRVPAATALEHGLINDVTPDAALLGSVGELAGRLAAGPPRSYAAIKRTLDEAAYPHLAEVLDREALLQQELVDSADFLEGVTAFAQKRPAQFTGN